MSREIKLRVWSKTLGKYRQLDETSNDQGLGMLFEVKKGIGSNVTSICYSFGDVVEQFTGLKDANGKEIYEGDIVRVFDVYEDVGYVDVVIWGGKDDYPAFDLKNHALEYDSNALSSIFNGDFEIIEVIGNIHNSPELLEAQHGN